ncbi:glucitol operon activator protein [Rhizobiales bacterium GAS191]|jgi:glucitol operon activator protein|nr:glucitol operon activator protein [Rhizobiales bacterium GAS113]SEC19776.1 glucitol operon activator protein [Rhizobiales bacterium GAS191]SED02443.1 glucitol operon activator protein [Rhizobiales bacterium GAS188]
MPSRFQGRKLAGQGWERNRPRAGGDLGVQLWQIALIVLVIAWGLQALGTFVQMRHYREVMGAITRQWSDGYLGAGNARAAFGKGVILLLVLGPDARVRRLLVMEGRSVLAKFKPLGEFEGRALDELRSGAVFGANGKGRETALAQAIAQIDKARAARQATEIAAPHAAAV